MRLELTAPVTVELEAEGKPRRMVAGLAVPWGVTARLSNGRLARFEPGSIDPNPDRAPLLCRNHDREHPIGVIIDAADNGAGIYARARISAVGAGDEALTLAADGVLRGLSVGVEALDWTEEGDPADPVIVVTAGRWDELSLVPWAAYTGAAVDYVAASAPDPPDDEPEPDDEPPDDEPDQPEGDPDVTDVLDAAAPVPAPGIVRRGPTPPSGQSLSLYAMAAELCKAVRAAGPAAALRTVAPMLDRYNGHALEAALTDVVSPSGTSGVAGLIRPQWENEIVGLIEFGAPVVAAFMQGNLDSNPVTYPVWTTLPTVDVQSADKQPIASGPVRIDAGTAQAATYAGGNDVAVQVIDWSSPDFISAYFAAASEMYARKIDAAMLDLIVTAATAATESTLADDLGAAIGAVASTGLPPDRIIVSGDKFGELWAANVGSISGAISQVLNIDLPIPRVVLAPLADPGTLIVTSSRVAKSWQNRGAPVQLRAVDVSLLGIDLGVYGYFAAAIVNGPTTANPAIVAIGPAGP